MRNIGVKLTKHSYNHFNEKEMSIRRDEVFKIVFGSEINKGYLKSFLEAILKREITDIKVKSEVSLEKIYNKNRLIKVDILAEIDKKELVNIEIQNKKNYNIIKRGEAHASKIFYNSLESGNEYKEAKKTIIIWILDFNCFKDGPYHEISKTVRESNGEVLSDDITYHFIQLERFFEEVEEIKTEEEQWLAYLSCQLSKEELEEVFEMNEKIRDVDKMAEEVLRDRELWETINDKIMEKNLYNLKMQYAREQGIEIGEENGRKDTKTEIARKMKKLGKPIEEIIELTELTKEEIEKL